MGLLPRVKPRPFLARLTAGLVCFYLATSGYAQVVSQATPVEMREPQADQQADQQAKALSQGLE